MNAIVIGAGIIGLSTAYYLQKSGWEVTILEHNTGSNNCSMGNAGMIVPSHFTPLAAPGILKKSIDWLLDSSSPFYIRPSTNAQLLKWGYQFFKSSTKKKARNAEANLLDLNLYSRTLYEELSKEPGFDIGFSQKGILMYYQTAKAEREELLQAERALELGLNIEVLNLDQLRNLQPGLSMNLRGAVHYCPDATIKPEALIRSLKAYLLNNGVQINYGTHISAMETSGHLLKRLITSTGSFTADEVIIAAGARMNEICRLLNQSLLLVAGKGYSLTVPTARHVITIPAILCEAKVAITPFANTMRYAGTMEIARFNDTVNMNRVAGIVRSVNSYFPQTELQMPDTNDVWFGYRPCTPDGLPYIGRLKPFSNVIIGGGHAMMGMSLAPATGKIISDIASNQQSFPHIEQYNPNRFS